MQLMKKKWNENPDKIIDIFEEILKFNKQQKGKGLKILSLSKYFKDYQ